jgi:Heat shock protein
MKHISFPRICFFSVVLLFSCKPTNTGTSADASRNEHNSRASLDWDGMYRGVLPCGDCEGVHTTLSLNQDLTYKMITKHAGKAHDAVEHSGTFTWNEEGSAITLNDVGSDDLPKRYFVGENELTQLDKDGKRITGESADRYVLSKEHYEIAEKYWKLTELMGRAVIVDSTFMKEPHIILKEKDNAIIGHGGCNRIFGTYALQADNRISFTKMASTQMACQSMAFEKEFLRVLQMADNFNLHGDTLTLNKARMAPLARFKAVYLK